MFSRIFQFFRRLLTRPHRRRDIFTFHDGTRWRSIDPLVAWHIMWASDGHLLTDKIKACDNGDWQSIDELTDLGCRMFGVRRFEEGKGGMTVDEINSLLADFLLYMIRIKKKRELSQIRLQHMVSQSNFSQDDSTTKAESGSSSTPKESNGDAPQKTSKRSFVLSGDAPDRPGSKPSPTATKKPQP